MRQSNTMCSRAPLCVVSALLFIVFVFLLPCKVSSEPVPVLFPRQVAQCLARNLYLKHPAIGTMGAALNEIGCVTAAKVGVNAAVEFNSSNWTQPDFSSTETTLWKRECAAACQNLMPTKRLSQIAIGYDKCICLNEVDWLGQHAPVTDCCGPNSTSYCSPTTRYVDVFELELMCPLNVSFCTGLKYCELSSGCCVPEGSEMTPNQASPLEIAQWLVVFFIVIAVFQVTYIFVRHRRRVDDEEDEELFGDQMLLMMGWPNLRRSDAAAEVAADRVMSLFHKTDGLDIDRDDHCPMCYEPLAAQDCVTTPCTHVLHFSCMREYLIHKLKRIGAQLTCPMCRAPLVRRRQEGFQANNNDHAQASQSDDDEDGGVVEEEMPVEEEGVEARRESSDGVFQSDDSHQIGEEVVMEWRATPENGIPQSHSGGHHHHHESCTQISRSEGSCRSAHSVAVTPPRPRAIPQSVFDQL